MKTTCLYQALCFFIMFNHAHAVVITHIVNYHQNDVTIRLPIWDNELGTYFKLEFTLPSGHQKHLCELFYELINYKVPVAECIFSEIDNFKNNIQIITEQARFSCIEGIYYYKGNRLNMGIWTQKISLKQDKRQKNLEPIISILGDSGNHNAHIIINRNGAIELYKNYSKNNAPPGIPIPEGRLYHSSDK